MRLRLFRNTVPEWVRNLANDDSNKPLLKQLARASKLPLETPREMNFTICDVATEVDATAICDQLTSGGWQCRIDPDAQTNKSFWVEAQKRQYVINERQLHEDETTFMRLAKQYNAVYDGWYAAAV